VPEQSGERVGEDLREFKSLLGTRLRVWLTFVADGLLLLLVVPFLYALQKAEQLLRLDGIAAAFVTVLKYSFVLSALLVVMSFMLADFLTLWRRIRQEARGEGGQID
jgi:hypothetical protein